MADALGMIEEGVRRKDPSMHEKEVGVFKTTKAGDAIGVIDIGDRSKTYIVDLEEINALSVLDIKENADLREIAGLGQDGKNFQKKQIGLVDQEGNADAELVELLKTAADPSVTSIQLGEVGDGFVEVMIAGDWSTDIIRLEGDVLTDVFVELSDIPEFCDALPTRVDFKDGKSDVGVFDFGDGEGKAPKFFAGDDGHVESGEVKQIYGGSKMELDEAVELVEYALSEEGQSDQGIEIDFNGSAIVLDIHTGVNRHGEELVDTVILKGDALFEALNTTTHNGKPMVDLKNKDSQIGVFDFTEADKYFVGSDSDVDNQVVRDIIGGSTLDMDEAMELVEFAQDKTLADHGIELLGGDDDSAIVAINASRDSTDVLFFDFG